MAGIRKKRTANDLIEIGASAKFSDGFFIRKMKDYREISRVGLLAWIEAEIGT